MFTKCGCMELHEGVNSRGNSIAKVTLERVVSAYCIEECVCCCIEGRLLGERFGFPDSGRSVDCTDNRGGKCHDDCQPALNT